MLVEEKAAGNGRDKWERKSNDLASCFSPEDY